VSGAIIRPATAHGYVRVWALDLPCAWAWERPDGLVFYMPAGVMPMVRGAAARERTSQDRAGIDRC